MLVVLTLITYIDHKLLPLHLNVTAFSLAIIIIGSFRSLEVMVCEFKQVFIKGVKSEHIESVSAKDAAAFPIIAGCMLCGLYALIKYFGKDSVNYFLMFYIALGSSAGIKTLLNAIVGDSLNSLDETKLINIDTKYFKLEVTILDIICLLLSGVMVAIYVVSKSWIYNNILSIFFCIHALQFIFLGNFKNGFLLLVLLFAYDIFFVFGTDIMITVAKNIDAPIKL